MDASTEALSLPDPVGLELSKSKFTHEEEVQTAGEGSLDEGISTG